MVDSAASLLAGGDPCLAALSHCLAFGASFKALWDNRERILQVHQGPLSAACKDTRRIKRLIGIDLSHKDGSPQNFGDKKFIIVLYLFDTCTVQWCLKPFMEGK